MMETEYFMNGRCNPDFDFQLLFIPILDRNVCTKETKLKYDTEMPRLSNMATISIYSMSHSISP